VGDPQFVGFLGQRYQVHGVSGEVYNLISDPSLSINAEFVFLSSGRCPRYTSTDGVQVDQSMATNCFAHPGSYFGRLSFRTANGGRVLIESGGWHEGFSAVMADGREVGVGEEVQVEGGMQLIRTSSHTVVVSAGLYTMELENSDHFINLQRVSVNDWPRLTSVQRPHGLLGQSWRRWTKEEQRSNEVAEVQGLIDDDKVEGRDMRGVEVVYTRFSPA
jgi:hypothetical protein